MNIETPIQTIKPNTADTKANSTTTSAKNESNPFKTELQQLKNNDENLQPKKGDGEVANNISANNVQNLQSKEPPKPNQTNQQLTGDNAFQQEFAAQNKSQESLKNLNQSLSKADAETLLKETGKSGTQKEAAGANNLAKAENKKAITKEKSMLSGTIDGKKMLSETTLSQEVNSLEEIINQKILQTQTIITKTPHADKKTSAKIADIDYTENIVKMDDNDALFFANLVKDGEFSLQNLTGDAATLTQITDDSKVQKSVQVSATLMESLAEAAKTNKPMRIDFDKNISVIIKIDKQGKLSAEFIPGDAAVENYLRNNVPILKQRFEEQGLNYNELSYRQRQQQNQKNNKENKDE